MSVRALQKLVGSAVISDNFRAGILNGRRAELLSAFDLDPDERAEVLAIEAKTVAEFAGAIEHLIGSRSLPTFFRPADRSGAHAAIALDGGLPSAAGLFAY